MSPIHAIIIVLIRLWAAGAIISAIAAFPILMLSDQFGIEGQPDPLTLAYAFNYMVWIIAGVAGWVFAPKLARLVFPKDRDASLKIDIDANVLAMLGSFLIGGYFLLQYAPDLLIDIGGMFIELSRQDTSMPRDLGTTTLSKLDTEQLIKTGLIIIVALWMMFRPAHVAYFFSRMRKASSRLGRTGVNEGKAQE